MRLCDNKGCNQRVPRHRTRYCSNPCMKKGYYLERKDKIIAYNTQWANDNPKRVKAFHKKAMDKYVKNNREKVNRVAIEYYLANKPRCNFHNKMNLYKIEVFRFHGNSCGYCGKKKFKLFMRTFGTVWENANSIFGEFKRRNNLDLNIYNSALVCKECRYDKDAQLQK